MSADSERAWARIARFCSSSSRASFRAGLLGGFTTFSAFGLDGLFLLRRGETATALLYAGGSVVLGLAAAWVGFRLVGLWPR
ncbi:MAG TPA: CrcB family protein [Luteimonas sp.]|nr:CrcB family protein [Luteimonas sp.]